MKLIATGKYNKPITVKSVSTSHWREMNIHEYKYYLRILWKKYPLTGKEYTVIQNVIEKINNNFSFKG